jgi:SAM-dependent methyltransferase
MNSSVPDLFDPVKVRLLEARALKIGAARFLLDQAGEDLMDRLALITRTFSHALDFGTPQGAFGARLCEKAARSGPVIAYAPDEAAFAAQLSRNEAAFDLIVSGMALHRINDLPGLLMALRRALKPDGVMLAVFPGGDSLIELRQALLQAESELTGGASMRVAPLIDVRAAGSLLQRAGFALPVVDRETMMVHYRSFEGLIQDLRAMGSTAALLKRGPISSSRALFQRAAECYAERFSTKDGRLRATFELIWISGWAPHASQQKPLKPGSATTRLADALKNVSYDEA